MRHFVLAAFLLVLLITCSGPNEPAICGRNSRVTITLSGDRTRPTIHWTPDCGVEALYVAGDTTELVPGGWSITSGGPAFFPPVRYGVVPAGTTERAPAVPLQPGLPYVVVVKVRWADEDFYYWGEVGMLHFRP